jgi:hypothetical protein
LKVHHIAGDLDGHDLPPAARQQFVAADEALEDQLAIVGTVGKNRSKVSGV